MWNGFHFVGAKNKVAKDIGTPEKYTKKAVGSNDGIIATLNPDPGLAERDGQSVKASKKEYYFVIILLFEPSLMNLL